MWRGKASYEGITAGSKEHTCLCIPREFKQEERLLPDEFNTENNTQNNIREYLRLKEGGN